MRCSEPACEHNLPFVEIFTRWPDLLEDLERAMIRTHEAGTPELDARGSDEAPGGDVVLRFVQHIQENVLTLQCPWCGSAVLDFDGCLALRCHSARCRGYFCGLCFARCDGDEAAHRHVRFCPERPANMADALFLPEPAWQRHIEERKARLTTAHIAEVVNRAGGPYLPLPLPLGPPLRSGDRVYVELADTDLYLSPLWFDCTTPGSKTYSAVVSRERARFRIIIGNLGGKGYLELRLDDRRHDYLASNVCLYNDGWDNVKFDEPGDSLTQKFVLDNDFSTEVIPGARVRFMDRCRFRYMVANMSAGSKGYAGGCESKKFLESRQPPYNNDIKDVWILVRAT